MNGWSSNANLRMDGLLENISESVYCDGIGNEGRDASWGVGKEAEAGVWDARDWLGPLPEFTLWGQSLPATAWGNITALHRDTEVFLL